MENKQDTLKFLNQFFIDSFGFWFNEGESIAGALVHAFNEAVELERNPFDPYGKLLDIEGKQEFIARIETEIKELIL